MAQTLNYTIQTSGTGGEILNWNVTGTRLSNIYTGAVSGTLTVASDGTASISFNLTTNLDYQSSTFVLTVDGGVCETTTDSVTVAGTGSPPPETVITEYCAITTVPYVYCPEFDGSGTLTGLNVKSSIKVYEVASGGVAIPSSLSVSGGSITAGATINVLPASANSPGYSADVLSSGFSTSTDGIVTGTLTSVKAI